MLCVVSVVDYILSKSKSLSFALNLSLCSILFHSVIPYANMHENLFDIDASFINYVKF